MAKLTFSEALEALNDQRSVSYSEVRADALRRMVWVAEWHLPGCLSESFAVLETKRDALQCALGFAGDEFGKAPRGMLADLKRSGRSDKTAPNAWARSAITTIERRALHTLF